MPLTFLLDEHLRGLMQAILRHNQLGLGLAIDAVCVGDPANLSLGSPDLEILSWAKRENRIVVTLDQRTMPGHLAAYVGDGRHSPGVIVVNDLRSWREIVAYLELVAHAGRMEEFADAVAFGP